jgi:hypothetical protein
MIWFTGTSLQLQLIITAHTLNSFLTPYDESLTALKDVCLTNASRRISHCCLDLGLVSAPLISLLLLEFRNPLPDNPIELTASKGSVAVFHECVASETVCSFASNGLVSKCLQLSLSVSMEIVFRNQLVSRNQSLSGNVFAHSFPRNGPHVTK